MKRVTLAMTILLLVPFLEAGSLRLSAHTRSDYYQRWWQVDVTPEWHFKDTFPTGNKRDRIKDGVQRWNALNSPMEFHWLSNDLGAVNYSDCPNDPDKSSVHWMNIDEEGGVLGQTRSCNYAQNDSLKTFHLRFDKAENWYAGTGDPGSSQFDLWGVAAHEFGHATGFGLGNAQSHFPQGSSICGPIVVLRETMCLGNTRGSTHLRTLEDHDKHTFKNRYPN